MLVCMAVAMFSCSKDDEVKYTEADILGKWNITSATPDIKVSDIEKIDSEEVFKDVLVQGSTLTFEEDEFSLDLLITLAEGSWKLNGEKLYLSRKSDGDKDKNGTEYVIQSMNKEKAVLLQPITSEGVSFNYIYNLEKK